MEEKTYTFTNRLKNLIYPVLDKMYKDKDYIDCAYEDIKDIIRKRDIEWENAIETIILKNGLELPNSEAKLLSRTEFLYEICNLIN